MFNYALGMMPSPPDERDFLIPDKVMAASNIGPYTTLYRSNKYDQGRYGTCMAFSLAQWTEANELRQRGVRIRYSPGFIYGNRYDRDYQGEGMYPREALIKALREGVVRWDQFPVIGEYPTCNEKLKEVYRSLDGEGLPNKIKGFVRLRTMEDVHTYMTTFNVGILFGLSVYESFLTTKADGIVPAPSGNNLGGHMMYAPDLTMVNEVLRVTTQNTWLNFGADQMLHINLAEQKGVEMWGPIPNDSDWLATIPDTIILTVPKDHTKRNDYMWAGNKKVPLLVGPFYIENKLCTSLREVLEACGVDVDWERMVDGSDMITIYPRGAVVGE